MSYIGLRGRNRYPNTYPNANNEIILNHHESGDGITNPDGHAGLLIDRGTLPPAFLRFDEESDSWVHGIEDVSTQGVGKTLKVIAEATLAKPDFIYLADVEAAPISILLPDNPTPNNTIEVIDLKGKFQENPVTVVSNNKKIMGSTEDLILDVNHTNIKFIFVDDSNGWIAAPSNPIAISAYNLPGAVSPDGGTVVPGDVATIVDFLNNNITTILPSVLLGIENDLENNPSTTFGPALIAYIRDHFAPLIQTVVQTVNGSMDPDIGPSVNAYLSNNITDLIPAILQHGINLNAGLQVNANRLEVNPRLNLGTVDNNFSPELYKQYLVNTLSNPVELTLPDPTTLQNGDWFDVYDEKNNFSINPVTIKYAGNNVSIDGYMQDKLIDRTGSHYRFVFNNNNWIALNYSNNQLDLYDNILISKSNNFSVENRKHYLVDTTNNPVYVNLPCNPTNGFQFIISDENNTFATNNVILLNNSGQTILGSSNNLQLDISGTHIRLVYNNGDWESATCDTLTDYNNIIVKSEDFVANVSTFYHVDSTLHPISITLPSNPLSSSWVNIKDIAHQFDTNNVTINATGGNTVAGTTEETFILDVRDSNIRLLYNNNNWDIIPFFD